jgi:hypothetical protein
MLEVVKPLGLLDEFGLQCYFFFPVFFTVQTGSLAERSVEILSVL